MILNKYDFDGNNYCAIELLKNTEEDWHSTLPGNIVKVRASYRPDAFKTEYIVYFCVIGSGQYRYDLEYKTSIEKLAREKFQLWSDIVAQLPDTVTKQMFLDLGLTEKTI
jgi:hypothetical protein